MNAKNNNPIKYDPIGIFHTEYSPLTGAPRQGGLMPESKSTSEIYPEYREVSNTLSCFEYFIVLYYFSEVKNCEPNVNSPVLNREHNFGLFVTRNPKGKHYWPVNCYKKNE